jgi:two-component system response regulator MtrA
VLIADDEPDMRALAGDVLRRADVEVVEAADAEATLEGWRAHRPDVILLDHLMPPVTGLHIARQILDEDPHQAIILFTALDDADVRTSAAALGIARCVRKQDVMSLPDHVRAVVNRE